MLFDECIILSSFQRMNYVCRDKNPARWKPFWFIILSTGIHMCALNQGILYGHHTEAIR